MRRKQPVVLLGALGEAIVRYPALPLSPQSLSPLTFNPQSWRPATLSCYLKALQAVALRYGVTRAYWLHYQCRQPGGLEIGSFGLLPQKRSRRVMLAMASRSSPSWFPRAGHRDFGFGMYRQAMSRQSRGGPGNQCAPQFRRVAPLLLEFLCSDDGASRDIRSAQRCPLRDPRPGLLPQKRSTRVRLAMASRSSPSWFPHAGHRDFGLDMYRQAVSRQSRGGPGNQFAPQFCRVAPLLLDFLCGHDGASRDIRSAQRCPLRDPRPGLLPQKRSTRVRLAMASRSSPSWFPHAGHRDFGLDMYRQAVSRQSRGGPGNQFAPQFCRVAPLLLDFLCGHDGASRDIR